MPDSSWDEIQDWVATGGEPKVLTTSGSTGSPKNVVLSHGAMVASAQASLDRLGGPGQWLLMIPPSGIGGLQVIVRSALAGIEPVVSHSLEVVREMEAERRYVSIVPTQLYRYDRDDELGLLAQFDAVLLGGAAADPLLVQRATDAGAKIVRTYGMTETCGGCVYEGQPLDGVSLRIRDDEIEISGPVLFDGYTDPSATKAVLRDGWFSTGDLGYLDHDGHLKVTGRADDLIKSGGLKVSLTAVTRAVKSLEGVHDAIVLGRPDPEWGQVAVAFVVPSDSVCLDRLRVEAVRDSVEEQGLDRRWAPREIVLVDHLPQLPSGKIDRQRLLGNQR